MRFRSRLATYRYKPVPVSALAIYVKIARESTAKDQLPDKPVSIENRFQTRSAFLRSADASVAIVADRALAPFAVRTFIVSLMSQGSEIGNREIHT